MHMYCTGVPHTLAKLAISNDLLLYPSLWLLVPGLSSHFCHCFLHTPASAMNTGQQYLWEMAIQEFISFGNPWYMYM